MNEQELLALLAQFGGQQAPPPAAPPAPQMPGQFSQPLPGGGGMMPGTGDVYRRLAEASGYPSEVANALGSPGAPTTGGDLFPAEEAAQPPPEEQPGFGSQALDVFGRMVGTPFRVLGAADMALRRLTGQMPNLYDQGALYDTSMQTVAAASPRLSRMAQRAMMETTSPRSTVSGRTPTGGSFGDVADMFSYAFTGKGISPLDQLRFKKAAYHNVVGNRGAAAALSSIAQAQQSTVSGMNQLVGVTDKLLKGPGEMAQNAAQTQQALAAAGSSRASAANSYNQILDRNLTRPSKIAAREAAAAKALLPKGSDIRADQAAAIKAELDQFDIPKSQRELVDKLLAKNDLDAETLKALGMKPGYHFREMPDEESKMPGFKQWALGPSTKIEMLEPYLNPEGRARKRAEVMRPDLFPDARIPEIAGPPAPGQATTAQPSRAPEGGGYAEPQDIADPVPFEVGSEGEHQILQDIMGSDFRHDWGNAEANRARANEAAKRVGLAPDGPEVQGFLQHVVPQIDAWYRDQDESRAIADRQRANRLRRGTALPQDRAR